MSILSNKNFKNYIYLALIYVFLTIGVIVVSFLLINEFRDVRLSIFQYYERFVSKWDVSNYIRIAENGYPIVGDEALMLVFFPFYPICIRILHTITTLNYELCASILSIVSAYFSSVMFYKLMCLDFSKETSFKMAKLYLMFPFSFFLFTRMSESFFLLLLFSCIYAFRKKKYLLAGILGYMVALTRLPGLAVGVIMLTDTIISFVKDVKSHSFKAPVFVKKIIMMITTALGFLTYLGINYYLYGTPFQFMTFQRDNWSQSFKGIHHTLEVIINSQLGGSHDLGFKIGVGVLNLVAMALVFIGFLFSLYKNNKNNISYALYTFVYLMVCFSSSWLLSGPRYSLGAFTIYMFFGYIASRFKVVDWILTILFPILMCGCAYLYFPGYMY